MVAAGTGEGEVGSMNQADLLAQISLGEDSTRQFKVDVHYGESLALDVAFLPKLLSGEFRISKTDKLLVAAA